MDQTYHLRDGWHFTRLPDGRVYIQVIPPDDNAPGPLARANITPDEWASIVAAVSATGETGASYAAARRLHQGQDA
jgi:hypothetical protein